MTHFLSRPGYPHTRRRFGRTLVASLTATMSVTAVTAVTPLAGTVSAAPATPVVTPTDPLARSSAPEIAAEATVALDLLAQFGETGAPATYNEYLRYLDAIARRAAVDLGLDGDEMSAAWTSTPQRKQIALLAALTQLGVPYRRMASEEGVGFDCSGLVSYAWGRAGVELPRSSRQQITVGAEVTLAEADAGDFVYYPGHIMMYLGVSTAIVHSPNSGNHVEIRFASYRRLESLTVVDPIPGEPDPAGPLPEAPSVERAASYSIPAR